MSDLVKILNLSARYSDYGYSQLKLKIWLPLLACFWMAVFPHFVIAFDDNSSAAFAIKWVTPPVSAERLEQGFFFSQRAKSRVSYHIYKPESYDSETKRRFPVIYWLHGGGGGLSKLPDIVEHFDAAIQQNRMPPALIVFPYGMSDSLWCDSKDGSVPIESLVIRELVPHIDATYRTIPDRKGRMVEGNSMGGYGAARFGFKYSDIFGSISIIAAGPLQQELIANDGPRGNAELRKRVLKTVFGNDQEYFKAQSPWKLAEKNAHLLRHNTMIRMAVGERDQLLRANMRFSEHMSYLRIPHSFQVVPDAGHNPLAVYRGLGTMNWLFYQRAFEHF